tara:strand:- start:1008 stop:1364 length:357 start_codon:yes stop_codon:yes gene_type:complete
MPIIDQSVIEGFREVSNDDLTIDINGKSHVILCGLCNEKITFIGEVDIESGQAGCAKCGNIDSVEEVARIATEYVKDEGQLIINRMARDTARNSEFMTVSGQTEHDKSHRFIVAELTF